MVVETRAPCAVNELETGESYAVPPKTVHYIHGKDNGPCRFLLLQGVGVYDNMSVGGYATQRRALITLPQAVPRDCSIGSTPQGACDRVVVRFGMGARQCTDGSAKANVSRAVDLAVT